MLMRSTQAWRIESSGSPLSPLTADEASAWCASAVAASRPAPELEDVLPEDAPLEDAALDDAPPDEPEPPLLLVVMLASGEADAPPSLPPLLDASSPPLDPCPPTSKPERSVDDGDGLQAAGTVVTPRTAARRARRTHLRYHPSRVHATR
jgi:hypothetical protein